MIRAVIIDDEVQARQIVRNYLEKYGDRMIVVGEADGVATGLDLINAEQPNLVFLDIRMQDGTGFDLLCKLPKINFKVIFVTAYDEFALRAFRFNAIDYLLKPLNPREFREALAKVRLDEEEQKEVSEFADQRSNPRRITLKTLKSIHIVNLDEIIRCESDNSYTTFFLVSGKSIVVSRSIKEVEQELTEEHFIRTHQSHIVNAFFIERFDKMSLQLQLSGGQGVPVAGRRKAKMLSTLERLG